MTWLGWLDVEKPCLWHDLMKRPVFGSADSTLRNISGPISLSQPFRFALILTTAKEKTSRRETFSFAKVTLNESWDFYEGDLKSDL